MRRQSWQGMSSALFSGLVAEDVSLPVVSYSTTAASAGRPSAASAAPSAPPSP